MYRLLVCLSLAAVAGLAAPENWQLRMQQGEQFRREGRHADAAESFREAVRLIPAEPAGIPLASALNSLAIEYDDLARYPDAEVNYRRALDVMERARGKNDADYAQTLANLGALYATMGRTVRGEKMMADAIVTFDSVEPAGVRGATCRNMLGQSMLRARRLDEAEPLFEQARRTLESKPLPDSGRLAAVLNNLAMVRRFQNRHTEALVFMQQSVARLEAEFGPDHPFVARMLNNEGAEYVSAGRPQDAEATYRRAADIAERTLGPAHPLLGQVLANYSRLLRETGRKAKSKRLAAQAREILRASARRNGAGMTVDAAAFTSR